MFHVGMYSVSLNFEQQLNAGDDIYPITDGVGVDNQVPYRVFTLPRNNAKLSLSSGMYDVLEIHGTLFEKQSPYSTFFSTSHVTLCVRETKTERGFKLRSYFDINDKQLAPQAWIYEASKRHQTKKQGTYQADFFKNKEDVVAFNEYVFESFAPVIRALRSEQQRIVEPLVACYHDLVKKMEDLEKLNTSAEERQAYIAMVEASLSVLDKLMEYGNEYVAYRSYKALHDEQLTYMRQLQDTDMTSKADVPVNQEQVDITTKTEEQVKVIDRIQIGQAEIERMLQIDNLNFIEAKTLKNTMIQIENSLKEYKNIIPASFNLVLYNLIIRVHHHLADYAVRQLFENHPKRANPFFDYITSIPEDLLLNCIAHDDSAVLSILLEKGKLFPTSLTKEKQFLFDFAYEKESFNCVCVFLDYGVPHIAMMASSFLAAFHANQMDLSVYMQAILKVQRFNQVFASKYSQHSISGLMSKSLQLINNLKQKKQIEYHQKIRDERDVHLQSTLDLLDTYAEIAHLSMFIYEQLPASLLSKFLKHQEKNNTLSNLFEKILPMIGGIKVSVEPMLPFIKPTLDLLKQINKNLNKLSVKDQNKLKKMMEKFFLNYTDVSVEQLSMDFMNTQWLKGSLAGLELYLFLSISIFSFILIET